MYKNHNAKAQRQHGAAAVEFAVILLLLLALIAFPIFFSRVFLTYSVSQKAAHNAAAYLATVPKLDMGDSNRSVAARDFANEIVNATIAEVGLHGRDGIDFTVECDDGPCGAGAAPTGLIEVKVRVTMYDDFLPFFTWEVVGDGPLVLNASAKLKYLGQ